MQGFVTKGKHSAYACDVCGTSVFTCQSALDEHYKFCVNKVYLFLIFKGSLTQGYKMPLNKCITFKDYNKMIPLPFVIYVL